MRVLHYGKFFPPVSGGIEKLTFDVVEGLARRDCKVDVLCFDTGTESRLDHAPAGYRIFRSGIFANVASTPLSFANVWRFLALASEYDVIHIHVPNPVANLALMLARPRAKIILHWHTDIVRQQRILFFYNPLQEWMLRRADAIIATSPPYVESSPWLSRYSSKTVVIPMGVDVGDMIYTAEQVAAIRQRFGGKYIVFALGRLVQYKGYEYLVRAAKLLPEDVVVLIGGGGDQEAVLTNLISELGLEKRVFLVGEIRHSDLGQFFAACDIFCLPGVNRTESYGLVQVEAMSFGKPIVSTNIPGSGVGWVNQDGVSGYVVEPGSPQALADAIIRALANPEIYRKLSDGARARFTDYFTTDHMVDRVLALYEQVVTGPALETVQR